MEDAAEMRITLELKKNACSSVGKTKLSQSLLTDSITSLLLSQSLLTDSITSLLL